MPGVDILKRASQRKVCDLIELVYRAQQCQVGSEDYEFSPISVQDHRWTGYHDMVRALQHPEALERPLGADGVFILAAQDLHQ